MTRRHPPASTMTVVSRNSGARASTNPMHAQQNSPRPLEAAPCLSSSPSSSLPAACRAEFTRVINYSFAMRVLTRRFPAWRSLEDSVRILTLDEAILRFGREKRNGRRVVFTNGCFDVLHPGHIRTSGASPRTRRRAHRRYQQRRQRAPAERRGPPAHSRSDERAEILAALECVDAVVIFDELTPREIIAALLPDVLVKGGDWADDQIVGREEVEAAGGRVVSRSGRGRLLHHRNSTKDSRRRALAAD